MKTLGLSKMGLNGTRFYQYILNHMVNLGDTIEVDTVNFDKSYDFILFDGGSDVSPELYNETKHPTTDNNKFRDEYEQDVFLHYKDTATKFVGICRGSQFLNVMMEGTLYQNLSDYRLQHPFLHNIEVFRSLEHYVPKFIKVNSTHHQAVKNLGKSLFVTAIEQNTGVIEAYQSIYDDKIRAVQFHPESIHDFFYSRDILKWLFRYF